MDFQDSMVNWTPVPEDQKEEFSNVLKPFTLAKQSSGFLASTPLPDTSASEYPEAVNSSIAKAMPIYNCLKELTLKLQE